MRFKHLVCPSRAHRGKYEFFFGEQQTWVDIGGKAEFVDGVVEEGAVIDGKEDRDVDAAERGSEVGRDGGEASVAAWVDGSTSRTPIVQVPVREDSSPNYRAATGKGIGLYGDNFPDI